MKAWHFTASFKRTSFRLTREELRFGFVTITWGRGSIRERIASLRIALADAVKDLDWERLK